MSEILAPSSAMRVPPSFNGVQDDEVDAFSAPVLRVPQNILRLKECYDGLQTTKKACMAVQVESSNLQLGELQEMQARQAEVRKNANAAAASSGFWSFLQKMGAFVVSVLSIVTGMFVSATNPLVGGLMITTGILSLGNAILQDTGGWDYVASKLSSDDKTRAALRFILPLIVTLLIATANLITLPNFSLVIRSLDTQGKIIEACKMFALLVGGASMVAQGVADARKRFADGELDFLKQQTKQMEASVDGVSKAFKQLTSSMKKVTGNVSKTLKSHIDTVRNLAQKV